MLKPIFMLTPVVLPLAFDADPHFMANFDGSGTRWRGVTRYGRVPLGLRGPVHALADPMRRG